MGEMYIVILWQTVSLYDNSLVWLDTLDVSMLDRNLVIVRQSYILH